MEVSEYTRSSTPHPPSLAPDALVHPPQVMVSKNTYLYHPYPGTDILEYSIYIYDEY